MENEDNGEIKKKTQTLTSGSEKSLKSPETSEASPIPTSESRALGILNDKINDLEKKYLETETRLNVKVEKFETKLEKDFERFEGRQSTVNTFMMWVAGAIIVVFCLTGITIMVDYFYNKGDGYKHFIDQVDSLKQNYYSKNDINSLKQNYYSRDETNLLISDMNKQLSDFKNCISQYKSYLPCLK